MLRAKTKTSAMTIKVHEKKGTLGPPFFKHYNIKMSIAIVINGDVLGNENAIV